MLMDFLAAIEGHLSLSEALPIILGLIIIEGLLSVDNALAIAAMAAHLDPEKRAKAMNIGYLGAYGFRVVALVFASHIIENHWVKLAGALYLIWLMCSHFSDSSNRAEESQASKIDMHHRTFGSTIMMISLMDLSLSVDNVVAAIALSPNNLWPVYLGVTIGIICLRLIAGLAVKMIERFPVLEHTAFVLVGYVGLLLLNELVFAIHVHRLVKFAGIVTIIGLSLLYVTKPAFHDLLKPLLRLLCKPMKGIVYVTEGIGDLVMRPFRGKPAD
ncbi:MAG: integral rane protein terc [Verrucomicrobiaceae bacterium]|nr:integral rane protein terc [Verrucomicrobiaceae bacterium]MDB6117843.1 integral rane protein terc [Verrucomicrobiaceae bacterium]